MSKKISWGLFSVLCLVVVGLIAGSAFAAPGMPSSGEKQHMKLVGYSDLQGRESLQVTAKGDFLFVGHHPGQHPNPLNNNIDEWNGTTVLDISNPKRPVILSHIPNSEETNSRAAQVMYNYMNKGCGDFLIRNHETDTVWKYEIFDITDKANPVKVPGAEITSGQTGLLTSAHKGWWDEGGLYYHSSNEAGWASQHLMIHRIELSDAPGCTFSISFVGKAWIPGQKDTEPAPSTDGVRPSMHHPIVDQENNRVYAAFLTGGDVAAWDVSTPSAPIPLWQIDTEPPGSGTHTVAVIEYESNDLPNFLDKYLSGEADIDVPQPPRFYALVADEATGGDTWRFTDSPPGVRHHARPKLYMFDVTNADQMKVPFPVETWQVPNAGYVDRGGRFGPHQFNETINGEYNRFADKIAYVPYFNAGVRTIDISDPYNIKEVGYYVPQENERCGNMGGGQVGPQVTINDVDVDGRGLIYASDRVGCGLYVLEFKK